MYLQRQVSSLLLVILLFVPVVTGAAGPAPASSLPMPAVLRADPVNLGRPPGASCTVDLFSNVAFGPQGNPKAMTATPVPFEFHPPRNCGNRWSKVVLEADFEVPAGRQYDRTTEIWLGGANLFFGTTQEPDATSGGRWHVERDMSDYAALFHKARPGQVILNNWLSGKYTSVIRGSARLVFYPVNRQAPAADAADAVYGLSGDPRGAHASVQNGKDELERQLVLPRNSERVYLDVIAQSQANDEQWYNCIDDAHVAQTRQFALGSPYGDEPLEECGGGNFREVQVSIDDQPAGLAPVYPWTYTGGVDPHLWRPIPDVQTLDFIPWRLDLTPFAGLLDDGRPHRIAVRVAGANRFFNLAANLLVYEDHGSEALSGRVVSNSLARHAKLRQPKIHGNMRTLADGRVEGRVDTDQAEHYRIVGELHTSHGTVKTTLSHDGAFRNHQTFAQPDISRYHQKIEQLDTVRETVLTRGGRAATHTSHREFSYPLTLEVQKQLAKDGSFSATIDMAQAFKLKRTSAPDGFSSSLSNAIANHDEADFNAMGTAITHARHQHGYQRYSYRDTRGSCYEATVEARDEKKVAAAAATTCPGGANHLGWRSRTDGAP